MSDQANRLKRLFNLHTFEYEQQAYPYYTLVTEQSAQDWFPKIWKWIDTALLAEKVKQHGVQEAMILLWPEKGSSTVWAYTYRDNVGAEPEPAMAANKEVNPADFLRSWLGYEKSISLNCYARCTQHVVAFYILYAKQNYDKKALTRLEDLLKSSAHLVVNGELRDRDGTICSIDDVVTPPPGMNYYQRLCVVFGCRDQSTVDQMLEVAEQIVCGLITTWGGALEVAKNRAKTWEHTAKAWSHEIGNFIRFLQWDQTSRGGGQHLYELAGEFLELITIATSRFDTLPRSIRSWPGIGAADMIEESIEIATRYAVLRDYRGSPQHEDIKTKEMLRQTARRYSRRFRQPVASDPTLILPVQESKPESLHKLGAFAQILIVSLYSAARHSPQDASIEIALTRTSLSVKNPFLKDREVIDTDSEIRAIIQQAFVKLWDETKDFDDFLYGPTNENKWLVSVPLPSTLWEPEP
jgi:hypothetical protein